MTEVQCPICDYVTDLSQAEGGLVPGLAESLGLTGLSTAQVDYIEKDMGEHLISHSVSDWVLAMRQADAYIAKLEQGLSDSAAIIDQLKADMVRPMPAVASSPPQMPPGAGVGLPPPILPAEWGGTYESPRAIQEKRAELRKAGLLRPPSETLIPVISTGQRAAGEVGRKF